MIIIKLGVHVSAAGKIYKSIERAEKLGCNTMQIFARNPRQWRRKSLSPEDIEIFRKKREKSKIDPVVVHAPYLLNLASGKESFHKITIREFSKDLAEADKLGVDYLVTHMGSYKKSTEKAGLLRIVEALNLILKNTKGLKTQVLIENTAGSGSRLGYKFSHFKFIFDRIKMQNRLGVCLDTAHAWAAGYQINKKKNLQGLISEIGQEVEMDKLKVVHLNDTQVELGSRLDRHFHIGEGNIGKDGFRLILNHFKLKNSTFILETPKKKSDDDLKNLEMVRRLFR
ncbi:MAG: deoxyribonuclease IV [Candidatus Omnitrophica bacterium]|nr:deoxyribonuclease IV [Candidatus Omnitrophota bacterium]MCF7894629.1 deoxyribonuclease IV [Candidatus Omnitrophota bacterium]